MDEEEELEELRPLRMEDLKEDQEFSRRKAESMVLTGYPWLDRVTGGLCDIWTIAGAPGTGRSTFALNLAIFLSRRGIPVLYCGPGESIRWTSIKVLCNVADVTVDWIRETPSATPPEMPEDYGVIRENLHLYSPRKEVTPEGLLEFIRHFGERIPVVFIDSLGSLGTLPEMRDLSPPERSRVWVGVIKAIEIATGARFVVVSEVSGEYWDQEPTLESLDEYRDLVTVSWCVLGLTLEKGDLWVIVLKNQYGIARVRRLFWFDYDHWRISEKKG